MVVDIHTYTVFYLKKNNRKILHVQERKKKMTNKELTKIREERKLSKKEFAVLLGITPMLLGRYEKGTCAIPENVAEKLAAAADAATAAEIEAKKNVRKTVRTAKEAAKETAEAVAQSDPVVATEIEVKKNTRKAARKVKETVDAAASQVMEAAKKAAGVPNIIIQSPMGGFITADDIVKKVPYGAVDVYVRVDENKLYYVLENGETGDVTIWD